MALCLVENRGAFGRIGDGRNWRAVNDERRVQRRVWATQRKIRERSCGEET